MNLEDIYRLQIENNIITNNTNSLNLISCLGFFILFIL